MSPLLLASSNNVAAERRHRCRQTTSSSKDDVIVVERCHHCCCRRRTSSSNDVAILKGRHRWRTSSLQLLLSNDVIIVVVKGRRRRITSLLSPSSSNDVIVVKDNMSLAPIVQYDVVISKKWYVNPQYETITIISILAIYSRLIDPLPACIRPTTSMWATVHQNSKGDTTMTTSFDNGNNTRTPLHGSACGGRHKGLYVCLREYHHHHIALMEQWHTALINTKQKALAENVVKTVNE